MNYFDFEISSKNDWKLFELSSVYSDIIKLIKSQKDELSEDLLSTIRECDSNNQLNIQYTLGSIDMLTELEDIIKAIINKAKED